MDEQEKEAIKNITDKLDRDVQLPPYNSSSGKGYSREYKEYKEQEVRQRELSRYERLCNFSSNLLNISAGERTREAVSPAIRLLDWEISPGMVISASLLVGASAFLGWIMLFALNSALGGLIPFSIIMILGLFPIGAGIYTYQVPKFAAQQKVIRSSGEMILSVLYMVVYMRSSPNLEGAVRFAGLNLDGPIASDLRQVLWNVEVGKYSSVSESLHEYTKIWKDFNDDYLQSLQLIEEAMNDPDEDRRETMLQDAIDSILDGTQERMKHYAQDLKTPVMILNALGAMLPVLGMIMLPLISVFMGGVITRAHLVLLFNVLLPATLFWMMRRLLSSRPPTTSSKPVDESQLPERGHIHFSIGSRDLAVPSWILGVGVFGIVSLYGWIGYLIFPHWYPLSNPGELTVPPIFADGNGNAAPMPMLLRSVSITLGLGLGIGVSKLFGNRARKAREDELADIESQFPRALFQLGNKIAGGTPIELALEEAADATRQMEISGLFDKASRNVRDMGMTFEQALFNSTHGALKMYPSRTIETVMKAVLESSQKGTEMAAMTMLTISRYLQNIHKTQEQLNDLLEDTTTTIVMLAYLLAPVVSGVAVGMSQTIITALFQMAQSFSGIEAAAGGGAGTAIGGAGFLSNLDSAIKPEMLQFVVGIYLIQLLYILGSFYIKIMEGEDETARELYTGKIMIVGCTFYTVVLVIVGLLFGGVVGSVASGV